MIEPGKAYKEAKRCQLDEGSGGTPAFLDKKIFVRGGEYLYCLGE